MKDKIYFDTNIWVYSALKNENELEKREKALDLIQSDAELFASTQVLNEFYNVLLKYKVADVQIVIYIKEIIENTTVSSQNIETLKKAWEIKQKYFFSLWDSLILASALENNCSILYTEDMHHNQLIENTLKIVNPFK